MSETHDRLRELGNCRVGDPLPTWMVTNNWGFQVSALCRDALAEIEKMQATMKRINEIVYVPTPAGTKAYTHFMRDFDEIRGLTKEYKDAADKT